MLHRQGPYATPNQKSFKTLPTSLQMRVPLPKRLLPLPHRHQVGVARHDPVEPPPQRALVQGAARPAVGAQAEEGRGDEAVVDALGLGEPPLERAVDVGLGNLCFWWLVGWVGLWVG